MPLFRDACLRSRWRRPVDRALQHAALVVAVAWAPAGLASTPDAPADWRDQVIYFAMIDRFDDGDARNNDQGTGEYDPRDRRRFSGGDLAGLTRRLDYIAGLGATAVWITPPVANQWWNDKAQYGGYHGYWTRDFTVVDAHFGTRASYRAFADALHGRGMRLVQDIVVNHTADYFGYDGTYDPTHPQQGFVLRPEHDGHDRAGSQPPFDRNDVRKPGAPHGRSIYHWTPTDPRFPPTAARSWTGSWRTWTISNTENSAKSDAALRDRSTATGFARWAWTGSGWTPRSMCPPDYFDRLPACRRSDRQPGVSEGRGGRPASTGVPPVFGEGFGIDKPYDRRDGAEDR